MNSKVPSYLRVQKVKPLSSENKHPMHYPSKQQKALKLHLMIFKLGIRGKRQNQNHQINITPEFQLLTSLRRVFVVYGGAQERVLVNRSQNESSPNSTLSKLNNLSKLHFLGSFFSSLQLSLRLFSEQLPNVHHSLQLLVLSYLIKHQWRLLVVFRLEFSIISGIDILLEIKT